MQPRICPDFNTGLIQVLLQNLHLRLRSALLNICSVFYFPGCMYQVWKSLCVLIDDETINIAFTSVAPLFCNNHQFIFNPYFVCYQKLGHFYFSQSPWLFLFAWWFWSLLLSIALARIVATKTIRRISAHGTSLTVQTAPEGSCWANVSSLMDFLTRL